MHSVALSTNLRRSKSEWRYKLKGAQHSRERLREWVERLPSIVHNAEKTNKKPILPRVRFTIAVDSVTLVVLCIQIGQARLQRLEVPKVRKVKGLSQGRRVIHCVPFLHVHVRTRCVIYNEIN